MYPLDYPIDTTQKTQHDTTQHKNDTTQHKRTQNGYLYIFKVFESF